MTAEDQIIWSRGRQPLVRSPVPVMGLPELGHRYGSPLPPSTPAVGSVGPMLRMSCSREGCIAPAMGVSPLAQGRAALACMCVSATRHIHCVSVTCLCPQCMELAPPPAGPQPQKGWGPLIWRTPVQGKMCLLTSWIPSWHHTNYAAFWQTRAKGPHSLSYWWPWPMHEQNNSLDRLSGVT